MKEKASPYKRWKKSSKCSLALPIIPNKTFSLKRLPLTTSLRTSSASKKLMKWRKKEKAPRKKPSPVKAEMPAPIEAEAGTGLAVSASVATIDPDDI